MPAWDPGELSTRFSLDGAWRAHLEEHGYAVVSALSSNELATASDHLWAFLATLGWDRSNPQTWTDESFATVGSPHLGIISGGGVGQSDFLWYLRTLTQVRTVFERIWDDKELLSSFDGANVFRPWHAGVGHRTVGGWLHVDQGPTKAGLQSIQGFVSLTDQDATTGGLVVLPGSHQHHAKLVPPKEFGADFVQLPHAAEVLNCRPCVVACRAGDLVLWDSRTVHCNTPGVAPTVAPDQLLRAVGYVCMTPKRKATVEVLAQRRAAYEEGRGSSHWPHTEPLGTRSKGVRKVYDDAGDRKALIDGG